LGVRRQWQPGAGDRQLETGNWKLVTGHRKLEARLRDALRRWRGMRARRTLPGDVDATPRCLHGVLVQDALDDIRGDLDEIREEMAWMRRVIVTAVVGASVATLLRMVGLLQ